MKKSDIRKYYLEKRKNLSSEEVEERSIQIAKRFFKEIDLSNVEYLHTFIPIKKFNEVNTWLIIDRVWKDHPNIKIGTSVTLKDKLEHYIINKDTQFVEDKWGIPIPQNCEKVDESKIDLVITPLLAFGKYNNRVGYGKGYYDKFFANCKPNIQKIGVSLFPQLEEEIEDVNQFDIPLDKVLFNN